MDGKWRIRVLNSIASQGLQRLPWERYVVGAEVSDPHALLLRSADLHAAPIPPSLLAVGRAGTGTNNIPVASLSAQGIPVFNAPGANANAVKELVLAGMLMASRHLHEALRFVDGLTTDVGDLDLTIEAGKKAYAGRELAGQTLGVIGLGKIGCLVAEAAINLGLHVVGYDPEITVEAAWSLPSTVKKAQSLSDLLRRCHLVTLHVPLVPATRSMIDAGGLAQMPRHAVLLNFSRGGVVDESAVLTALHDGLLSTYVTDFPSAALLGQDGVLALPHLGASTREAEENCAVMVADQVRDYLEDGTIRNSVNFPDVVLDRAAPWRVAVAHENVPNMVGGISHELAAANLNIATMTNKSRRELAYTVVDVDSEVPEQVIKAIGALEGVLKVRLLPAAGTAPNLR